MKKIEVIGIVLAVLVGCIFAAGCIVEDEPEFEIDVLDLESDDGYYWTAYVLVTNLDSRPIECTLDYTFMDNHGNEVGHTTQDIGKIAKNSHKSAQATIRANKYVDQAYVNVICEAMTT